MHIIRLTKKEVENLKDFCDENLAVGTVNIIQEHKNGTGFTTHVYVTNLPETYTDITDLDSW